MADYTPALAVLTIAAAVYSANLPTPHELRDLDARDGADDVRTQYVVSGAIVLASGLAVAGLTNQSTPLSVAIGAAIGYTVMSEFLIHQPSAKVRGTFAEMVTPLEKEAEDDARKKQ